ncbi:unnamed protein product [Musa acuminata var. zebrina]
MPKVTSCPTKGGKQRCKPRTFHSVPILPCISSSEDMLPKGNRRHDHRPRRIITSPPPSSSARMDAPPALIT